MLCLCLACSQSPGVDGEDGGAAADSGSGGGDGGQCTSAGQCGGGGRVCNPATLQCTAALSCSGHLACGVGAHCAAGGTCAPSTTGSPCENETNCISREACTGGFCGCGGQAYSAESVPANVLIAIDRSGSMGGNTPGSKWMVAKQAIADLLAARGNDIRFGLALFPGTNQSCSQGQSCGSGAVFVDPADGTATAINDFLRNANTCSFGTPTGEMLTTLLTYSGLKDVTRANYVLVVSDGQSNCPVDPILVVTSLRALTPSVKTFVVGFGADVGPDELNGMAQEGGTAIVGGPPYYYVAGDAASLASAFSTIAGSVLSCTYTLSGVPPALDKLYVYQNKVLVPRDTQKQNGWDYAAATNQVTFYGPACTAMQAGQVTDLAIVYGCPLNPQ